MYAKLDSAIPLAVAAPGTSATCVTRVSPGNHGKDEGAVVKPLSFQREKPHSQLGLFGYRAQQEEATAPAGWEKGASDACFMLRQKCGRKASYLES